MAFSFLTPDPAISYDVVFKMYSFCVLLFIIFYSLESFLETLDDSHWLKENLSIIKGVYVIFAPFCITVFWSAYMSHLQKKQTLSLKKD
ncbi:hypothetical protein TrVE_jg7909 [Triparma verrucosa]|uniref:Uncharacterized protein n=1 Tax=Triparma verrucosa TaxID=1606542 RepID=A0A9W7BU82_9STRA|nr:hypothetical protein TrVE_jg7909 [Triparma verrucosa]